MRNKILMFSAIAAILVDVMEVVLSVVEYSRERFMSIISLCTELGYSYKYDPRDNPHSCHFVTVDGGKVYPFKECNDVIEFLEYRLEIMNKDKAVTDNDKPDDNMIETINYIQNYISEKGWYMQYAFHADGNYYWYVYDDLGKEVIVEKSIADVADAIAKMQYNNVAKFTTDDPVEVAHELSVGILADKLAALALTVSRLTSNLTERVDELQDDMGSANEDLDALDYALQSEHKERVDNDNMLRERIEKLEGVHERLDKEMGCAAKKIHDMENKLEDQGCGSIYACQERITKLSERMDNDVCEFRKELGEQRQKIVECISMCEDIVHRDKEDIKQLISAASSSEDIVNLKEAVANHNELLSKILDRLEHKDNPIKEADDYLDAIENTAYDMSNREDDIPVVDKRFPYSRRNDGMKRHNGQDVIGDKQLIKDDILTDDIAAKEWYRYDDGRETSDIVEEDSDEDLA